MAHAGEVFQCLFVFAFLDKVSGGFMLDEGEDTDEAGENDVQTGWDSLYVVSSIKDYYIQEDMLLPIACVCDHPCEAHSHNWQSKPARHPGTQNP